MENNCNKLWKKILYSTLGTSVLSILMITYDLCDMSNQMKSLYEQKMLDLDFIANNSELTIDERRKILSHFIDNYVPNYMGESFREDFLNAVLSIREQHNEPGNITK